MESIFSFDFSDVQSESIGIIGGSDGPTAIIVSEKQNKDSGIEPVVFGVSIAIIVAVCASAVALIIRKLRKSKNPEDK